MIKYSDDIFVFPEADISIDQQLYPLPEITCSFNTTSALNGEQIKITLKFRISVMLRYIDVLVNGVATEYSHVDDIYVPRKRLRGYLEFKYRDSRNCICCTLTSVAIQDYKAVLDKKLPEILDMYAGVLRAYFRITGSDILGVCGKNIY